MRHLWHLVPLITNSDITLWRASKRSSFGLPVPLGWVLLHNSKHTSNSKNMLIKTACKQTYIALIKSLQKEHIEDKHRTKNSWEKQVVLTANVSRIQVYRKLSLTCCIFSPVWNPNFHTVKLQLNKGLLVHSKRKPATNFGMKDKVFKLLWKSSAQESNYQFMNHELLILRRDSYLLLAGGV